MKFWPIIGGIAFSVTLAGCADKSRPIATPSFQTPGTTQAADVITQPAVTGTVWIRQPIELPPEAVLTVTLSDASLSNVPATVISQRVMRTH